MNKDLFIRKTLPKAAIHLTEYRNGATISQHNFMKKYAKC